MNLVYIEPSSKQIESYRQLLKIQRICKQQLEVYTDSDKSDDRDDKHKFGFLYFNLERLDGFILCEHHQLLPEELNIELVCHSKEVAKRMIEEVQVKVKDKLLHTKKLTLYCLYQLKKWYESLGFTHSRTIYTEPKILYMVKII